MRRTIAVLLAVASIVAFAGEPGLPIASSPVEAAVQPCPAPGAGLAASVTYECTLGVGESKTFSTGVHGQGSSFVFHARGYGVFPVGAFASPVGGGSCQTGGPADLYFKCNVGLPVSGSNEVTLTIREVNGTAGTIRFSHQRADAGAYNTTPIALGTPMQATLEAGGMITKTITATQLQGFLIWQGGHLGLGTVYTRVYDASGNELCVFTATSLSSAKDCSLFLAGPLTFITYQDQADDRPLSQVIYDTGLAANADAPVIHDGEVVAGTTPADGMARYRYPMAMNDDIVARAGALTTSTQIDGLIPTVIMVTTDDDEFCTNGANLTIIAESRCDAFAPATAIIFVDLQRVTGARSFSLQTYNDAGSSYRIPVVVPNLVTHGALSMAVETDVYTYLTEQGSDTVFFSEPPGRSLRIDVYDPFGSLACVITGPSSTCPFGSIFATWRLYVRDDVTAPPSHDTGPYAFEIACSLFCFPDPEPDFDADGVPNTSDTCPAFAGAQTNTDAAPLVTAGAPNDITRPAADGFGDICDPDDDNDGLVDAAEAEGCGGWGTAAATNPLLFDTDGDRSGDLFECAVGTNPASAASKPNLGPIDGADNDGLPPLLELLHASSDTDLDSDDDGIQDGLEVRGYGSQPQNVRSESEYLDGCPDDREIASVNVDDIVSSLDLIVVAQRFFMTDKPVQDVNKDGTISALDLSLMAQNFFLTPCNSGG